jgi:hypothetical protein
MCYVHVAATCASVAIQFFVGWGEQKLVLGIGTADRPLVMIPRI